MIRIKIATDEQIVEIERRAKIFALESTRTVLTLVERIKDDALALSALHRQNFELTEWVSKNWQVSDTQGSTPYCQFCGAQVWEGEECKPDCLRVRVESVQRGVTN